MNLLLVRKDILWNVLPVSSKKTSLNTLLISNYYFRSLTKYFHISNQKVLAMATIIQVRTD